MVLCVYLIMKGYSGRILHLDMTAGKAREEELIKDVARKFIGGRGIASKILFEGTYKGVDPLGPDNILVFAVGPLADTPVPGAARFVTVAKSPLTGAFGEAYAGGTFGLQMRRAGFDAIAVHGRAEKPVYVSVTDGKVEFNDASGIWGGEVKETNETVLEDVGVKGAVVACIGPAGENRVRFANIMSDGKKAAGRCGLGAVMGSKNLKAIALHGVKRAEHANEERLKELGSAIREKALNTGLGKSFSKYGTAATILQLNETGQLPTKNYSERQFDDVGKLDPELILKIIVGAETCPGCAIRCKKAMSVTEGKWAGVIPEYGGAEFETFGALGSNCMNSDLNSIAWMSQRCNALGMDTISAGGTFSMLMDATEQGLVSEPEMQMQWGDADGMAQLIEKIGHREGIGDKLAEGGARVAADMGCPELSCNSKGLEAAMHEPRVKKALGLGYATANRGATHMEVWQDPGFGRENGAPELGITVPVQSTEYKDKGRLTAIAGDVRCWQNSLITCYFNSPGTGPARVNKELVGAVSAATGWDYTIDEMLETGRRIYNLCRLFNVREGFGRAEDAIPFKYTQPTTTGRDPNEVISPEDHQALLDDYYSFRGWDSEGRPLPETLEKLGLACYGS